MPETSAEPSTTEISSPQQASHPAFGNIGKILDEASSLGSAGDVMSGLGKELRGAKTEESPVIEQQKEKTVEKVVVPEEGKEEAREDHMDDPTAGGRSDIKRAAVAAADEKREDGSALESFRQDMSEGRTKKFKESRKAKEGEQSTEGEETKAKEAKDGEQSQSAQGKDEEAVTMAEIEKELDNKALSKRHQARMKFLHAKAKEGDTLRAEVEDLRKKAQSASTGLDPKAFEEAQKKLADAEKELLHFRRRYSLDNDKEIKAKYDDVITASETSILEKLKSAGVSEAAINAVKSHGGFENFSRSNTIFNVKSKDADGNEAVRQITAAELAKNWLDTMPIGDAKYVEAKMIESFNLRDAKKREVEKLTAEAESYFAEQRKAEEQRVKQSEGVLEQSKAAYNKWATEWTGKQQWLSEQPVNPGDSPEKQQAAKEHNSFVVKVKQLVNAASSLNSIEDYAALVEGAARSAYLSRELSRARAELEAAKANLEKMNKGMKSTQRGGTVVGKGLISEKEAKKEESGSALESFQRDLDKLRAGGSIDNDEE